VLKELTKLQLLQHILLKIFEPAKKKMINPKLYNTKENRVVKITSKTINEETKNKANNIYKIERRQKDRRKNQATSFEGFIKHKVEQYFVNLEGHEPTDLYDLRPLRKQHKLRLKGQMPIFLNSHWSQWVVFS